MSFVAVEALGDKKAFKVRAKGVERVVENRRGEGSPIDNRAENAIAEARAALLEEDGVRNGCGELILEQETGFANRSGEGEPDSRRAAVKEKFLALSAGGGVNREGGRARFTGGVVVIAES